MGYTVTSPSCTSPARGRPLMLGGRIVRGCPSVCVLVAFFLIPAVVRAQAMRWPEAVAALAGERTRAEDCARRLKRHAGDDAAARSRSEHAYAKAKAEVDEVIAGLTVVLAQGDTPASLSDLEARLTRGVQAREALCQQALALIPEDPGTRDLRAKLVGAFLPLLLEAARTLSAYRAEQDRLLRQTIQTQLEGTKWPDFADITP
jgi:hypothetical protein